MKENREHKKTVTIHDVAKRADVAVGTVSRYLNGYTIRPKNKSSIEKAIQELDYKENILAKILKTQHTLNIGAVVPGFDRFHIGVLKILERQFFKRGYNLIIGEHEHDPSILLRKFKVLFDRYIDGLVYSPTPVPVDILLQYQRKRVPIVLFNDHVPKLSTDMVVTDNFASSFRAIEHFILMNHKKIAIIGGPKGYLTADERFEGFREAHKRHGISIRQEWVKEGDWLSPSGYLAARTILERKERPTAIFVTNCVMAVGALQAIKELGLNIPEDISFISYDDIDMFRVYRPGITAIEQPVEKIAQIISDLMLRRLAEDYEGFPYKATVTSNLILRESVKRL